MVCYRPGFEGPKAGRGRAPGLPTRPVASGSADDFVEREQAGGPKMTVPKSG